jgi:REP element-mobilizing transposase RayT
MLDHLHGLFKVYPYLVIADFVRALRSKKALRCENYYI